MARKLRVIGLMPTDAEVIRADRLLALLQCARLLDHLGHVDLAASMRADIPGFLVTFGLGIFGYVELLDMALAFSSTSSLTLCATCEAHVMSSCGFGALLSFCSGPCPCVAAPVGVLDLTKPDACVPACRGASVTNTCVLAGGVHAEEAPASARSSACYAVPETSAVQQPVMKVHSESTAFCACVDVPVAEQNFQMDIPPELPVHSELQCADGVPFEEADGVPFEEAGDRVSPASVDDDAYGALEPSRSLVLLRVGWCPMSKTAIVRLDLAVDAGIGCPAVSVPVLHPAMADLSSVMCPSWPLVMLHISWCPASSDAVVSIRMTDGAGFGCPTVDLPMVHAVASDPSEEASLLDSASIECLLDIHPSASEFLTCMVTTISERLVAEITRTLLLAVVYPALATRCRVAFAVSSSVAVEFIDPGCDPPLLSCY
jgi:hypothetical protein